MQENQANCPICDFMISAGDDVIVSEILTCPECSAELEVKQVAPMMLEEAPAEEEDWGQ
jgi:alpha-aminoadipate carrier protein LysW